MKHRQRLQDIAAAYDALPTGRTGDPAAERSYEAFRQEILRLFAAIPVRVERWARDGQPYAGSRDLFAQVERTGRLWVYTGGEDHPFLSRTENEMFRAVHDFYRHFLSRFAFGPVGEFHAWLAHCGQFCDEAIPAMTAETLGQNCWFNFGPHAHLSPQERPYAVQKASVLPEELWRPLLPRPQRERAGSRRPLAPEGSRRDGRE